MRSRRGLPLQTSVCDINVTNLVDVTMVLLIVFILVAPMIENRIQISLPEMENSDDPKEPDIVSITITQDKKILWEKEIIPLERIIYQLKQEKGQRPRMSILLRADRRLEYGFVMDVMDRIKGSGIDAIDLATSIKPQG